MLKGVAVLGLTEKSLQSLIFFGDFSKGLFEVCRRIRY